MLPPLFFYDFNSPYAYLASTRVDELLPVAPRWQPIAFAFVLRAHDRIPWSMVSESRRAGVEECERRARRYGLPALRWPPGWPVGSYSLPALRAACAAREQGALREFSRAAFARNFVSGLGLRSAEDVMAAARAAGLDPLRVAEGMVSETVKQDLRAATEQALGLGVRGVPTVAVGEQLFWGDDQLDLAAAAVHKTGVAA